MQLVHDWANNKALVAFKAVYFLFATSLNGMRNKTKEALVDEIVKNCFPFDLRSESDRRLCQIQVTDDLERSTTLLVLNDCGKVDAFGNGILKSLHKLGCKQLLTVLYSEATKSMKESENVLKFWTEFFPHDDIDDYGDEDY